MVAGRLTTRPFRTAVARRKELYGTLHPETAGTVLGYAETVAIKMATAEAEDAPPDPALRRRQKGRLLAAPCYPERWGQWGRTG
jgi:hypothetical protein